MRRPGRPDQGGSAPLVTSAPGWPGWRVRGWLALLMLTVPLAAGACEDASRPPPAAAIASAHPLATEAGFAVLADGGNAFDAAVAVSAVLGVVEPAGSGLGGGGFWLLHRATDCRQVMLDGRERAPLAAHPDLYLDEAGQPRPRLSLDGALAAGIPGSAAALVRLAEDYGRLSLARGLADATRLARDGFAIDEQYRQMANWRLDALRASPAAAEQLLVAGEVPPLGHRLRQPDLAQTLERLADGGHAGFYGGVTADRLVAGVRAAGGIWTHDDLAQYRVVERAPIVGSYRGWRLVSAPPPSSGGVLLVQMLNMLSALGPLPEARVARTHTLVEVMRRAYRDRDAWLGDPDQVTMPLERLLHPAYAAGLIRDFDPKQATPSRPRPADEDLAEGQDTTHFSILDREGNRVAATLSLNYPFGAAFVPPGTGVLLNDEMDDFATRPGSPNAYGLVGGEPNRIAPGKRMLSSMSPTFLESTETLVILGTPGGSRIITMVLQGLLASVEGTPVEDWIAQPRIHHQFIPDRVELESGALSPADQRDLGAMGHRLEPLSRPMGNMQVVVWDRARGLVKAASDPRGGGLGTAR